MAGGLMKLACLVLACMIVAGPAEAALTCGSVNSNMAPCIGYLTQGGALPPACCNGVRNLNGMARTTPDRQQACRCLQGAAKALGSSLKTQLASGLPKACKVNVPYAISTSTNCNNVK